MRYQRELRLHYLNEAFYNWRENRGSEIQVVGDCNRGFFSVAILFSKFMRR
jgi:hypothetical protein